MARTGLTAIGRALPAAARIAAVYIVARLVTTGFFLLAAQASGPDSRFGVDPDIGTFALGWDAQWYWYIDVFGYPSELPLTDSGLVAENAWAFMPVFPFLARILGAPFGSWIVGAVLVSLIAGYFACLALHALLKDRIGRRAAIWAVAFFAFGPLSAMFQVGYAESLWMLWLLLALVALVRRTYWWLYLLIPLMGFTRPGVLAFGLLIALVGLWRIRTRRTDPLRRADVVHILALGALATVVGFSWQVIAAIVTGDPSAYLMTELAWRRNWIAEPATSFLPFDGVIASGNLWFGIWGVPEAVGWIGLGVLVAGFLFALVRVPQVRALGIEVRLWSLSYVLYLAAVFFPQSSLFRLLLPLAPLSGALAAPRSRVWRIGVLVVCIGLQWVWILNGYGLADTFWRIP